MAKQMGDIVRFEPASQHPFAAFLIVFTTAIVLVNAVLFILGLALGWNHPIAQTWMGIWLANTFFGLAIILILYRRFFADDVLVVKKRHPKYEDFLEKYDIE